MTSRSRVKSRKYRKKSRNKERKIGKKSKTMNIFFKDLLGEIFLFLEKRKYSRIYSRPWAMGLVDPWYEDIKNLLHIFKKFRRFYLKKSVKHPVLNLIIMSIVITYFHRHFEKSVCRSSKLIILRSRSKLKNCSKKNILDFYESIQDAMECVSLSKDRSPLIKRFQRVLKDFKELCSPGLEKKISSLINIDHKLSLLKLKATTEEQHQTYSNSVESYETFQMYWNTYYSDDSKSEFHEDFHFKSREFESYSAFLSECTSLKKEIKFLQCRKRSRSHQRSTSKCKRNGLVEISKNEPVASHSVMNTPSVPKPQSTKPTSPLDDRNTPPIPEPKISNHDQTPSIHPSTVNEEMPPPKENLSSKSYSPIDSCRIPSNDNISLIENFDFCDDNISLDQVPCFNFSDDNFSISEALNVTGEFTIYDLENYIFNETPKDSDTNAVDMDISSGEEVENIAPPSSVESSSKIPDPDQIHYISSSESLNLNSSKSDLDDVISISSDDSIEGCLVIDEGPVDDEAWELESSEYISKAENTLSNWLTKTGKQVPHEKIHEIVVLYLKLVGKSN